LGRSGQQICRYSHATGGKRIQPRHASLSQKFISL